MPRPSRPIKASSRAMTKKDKSTRIEIESRLKVGVLKAEPPEGYSAERKAIYRFLYDNIVPSGFVGTLDALTIDQACVVIDRLRAIDRMIDERASEGGLTDKELRSARVDYFKQYLNVCTELCLSPAARAKMGTLIANAKPADPLNDLLGGGDT